MRTPPVQMSSKHAHTRSRDERHSCVFLIDSVIAVPGLASHAIGSWKSPSSNDLWLRDYLPYDVRGIRILLYGYDTSLRSSNSKDSVEDLGRRFLESLIRFV